ncbi:uncharacterized protein J7T54_001324 [Emericellopsis cladophorae]|uniref:Uncharacterized protein n=1 Tax=Emericellopsis cladophorae TaxID=2686198 RepID=A0A9Q0BEI0_9HYPO|nr:uncharacterized protein J7T54_001324 [Emericellopsis cladophorae]KAI6782467.1 hypothetical protein J7T54_001324 [Emericellopsis cladophorae]
MLRPAVQWLQRQPKSRARRLTNSDCGHHLAKRVSQSLFIYKSHQPTSRHFNNRPERRSQIFQAIKRGPRILSSGTTSRSASPESATMASSGQEDPEAQGPIAPWGNDTTLQGEAQAHSEPQLLPEHFNATMATSPTMSTVTPAEAVAHKPSATNYHIITIPFHNSTRALYFATMRSHMSTFEKFNTTYSAEDYSTPDEQLQSEIEEALTDLVYTCDYGGESLEIMPDTDIEKQMRHVVEKVSKVQFLHELLPALGPINVLIVVGSDNLTRLMIHLISRIHKLPWSCPENPAAQCDPRLFTDALQAPRITIATPRHAEAGDFDLVIAYDRSFDGSAMASSTAAASATQSTPTVLRLVTTLSVEHLELAIAGESGSDQGPMENLEKTMRLVWALVHTQPLLDGTPEPGEPSIPDQSEPHRIAKTFAAYLNGQVTDLDYEPVQVPTHVLQAFLTPSSPAEEHSVTDLKRKLEDDTDDPGVPGKRMRRYSCIQPLFPTDTIPVPSDVRNMLKSAGLRGPLQSTGEDQVGMPIATLRALAAQTTLELAEQAHLKKLDELCKTHEADYAKFEEAQRAHLRDRDHFESIARDLQKKLNTEAAQSFKRQEKDAAEITQLAATVARLTAEGGDPLVQSESLVKEAQGKIKLLEKQIDQAKVDRGFAFEQYQAASSTAEELRDEVKKLAEANKDLQRRADANVVEIHRMNKDGIVKRLENLLSAEQIAKREMIQENHALREQIRQLKMARRDTRHSSVPRSPRTGIMSPRPQRPTGPSSVSRGASPAPVMGSLADIYNGGNGAFSRTPGAQFTSTNNSAGDRS